MKTNRSTLTFIALLAILLGLAACGPATSDLIVVNDSSADFCAVYLSGEEGADIGGNLLGSEQIAAGSNYTIEGIEAGVYDVRFVPCDTASFEENTYENLDLTTDIEYTLFDE